jgi:type II secretory pathway pseudopilin PulG
MRARGFTILETTIAVAVLTIGVLGAASALTSSLQLSREARNAITAADDLQCAVEMIRGASYNSLYATFPPGQPLATFNNLHFRSETVTLVGWYYYDQNGNEQPIPSPPPTFPTTLPNSPYAMPGGSGTIPAALPYMEYRISIVYGDSSSWQKQTVATAIQTVAGLRTPSE